MLVHRFLWGKFLTIRDADFAFQNLDSLPFFGHSAVEGVESVHRYDLVLGALKKRSDLVVEWIEQLG